MTLAAFFAEMQPMLLGRVSAADVQRRLGPSPSGTAALQFYAVLVARNVDKILREICPTLFVLATRAGVWRDIVDAHVRAHPPAGGDPNRFADALPELLQELARRRADVPPLFAELADYHVVHVRAHHAVDGDDDGFERRLFVRQYAHPVAEIVDALSRDPNAAVPAPHPALVVVFRHARTLRVRRLVPSAAGLAALARRQALALPPALASLADLAIVRAERALVREGVLVPRLSSVPSEKETPCSDAR